MLCVQNFTTSLMSLPYIICFCLSHMFSLLSMASRSFSELVFCAFVFINGGISDGGHDPDHRRPRLLNWGCPAITEFLRQILGHHGVEVLVKKEKKIQESGITSEKPHLYIRPCTIMIMMILNLHGILVS